MKKKLFLFITCFFLLSSLTIFLAHRNTKFLEIIKKKEEEVKRLLKKLKKSNLNQKDENEDYQEETDNLPWLFTWKGTILPLVVSGVITVPAGNFLGKSSDCETYVINVTIFVILFLGLFPLLSAIAKYKDKSYKERYCLLWQSYWKTFLCFNLSWLFFFMLLAYDKECFEENNNDNNNNYYQFQQGQYQQDTDLIQ